MDCAPRFVLPAGIEPMLRRLLHTTVALFVLAGAFDATQVESAPWDEVEFAFPDCNALRLRYDGSNAAYGAPGGSGTRNWERLVNIKGLACE